MKEIKGMKATMHVGKQGASKHNDRAWEKGEKDIVAWNPYGKPGQTFKETELACYEKWFGNSLAAKNARYKKEGHEERCHTMLQELTENRKTMPTEIILQIGKEGFAIDPEDLKVAFKEWADEMEDKFKCMVVMNAALHLDETTPHIHVRLAFSAQGKDGFEPNREKALEQMNVELPDPGKAKGRFNNRLMTFTEISRDIFYAKVKERGYEIDELALGGKHYTLKQHKAHELDKQIQEKEERLKLLNKQISDRLAYFKKQIDNLRNNLDDLTLEEVKKAAANISRGMAETKEEFDLE